MKMSNRTLVKTINGLLSFKNNGVRKPIKAIYAINRNIEMLDKAAIPFQESRNELIEKYCDKKKNGDFTAGERLSITNISFSKPVEEDFYSSHVWDKIKKILLIHYLRDKTIDRWQYQIKYVNMFSPPAEDLNIIIQDYNKIINKIKKGKAHEISESDTLYLGACTKGKDAKSSMIPQYYGEHILARRRNFCFKRQYMDYVLHEYV